MTDATTIRVFTLRGGPLAGKEVRFEKEPPREVEVAGHPGVGRYVLLAPGMPWGCYVWSVSS